MVKVKLFTYENCSEEKVNNFLNDYHYELVQFQYIKTQGNSPIIMISYKESD